MTPQEYAPPTGTGVTAAAQTRKKCSGLLGRMIRRFFLLLLTVILLALAALYLVMNLAFNGPSATVRNVLTMSLIDHSAFNWVPALFIGEDALAQIQASADTELPGDFADTSKIVIKKDIAIPSESDEWADYPDGIRIEHYASDFYNAHIMIIRDPSQVYLATSSKSFSPTVPGKRITSAIVAEGAIAAINAGAFNDDGSSSDLVGSYPLGLVMSNGSCVWTMGKQPGLEGFAGFNEDNILVVSKKNLTKAQAKELNIRDGCCFGPALIINGEINTDFKNSGYNARTAIGQREDGAVLFVCIDGRQPGSIGGTYVDIQNIMIEYGAVNACNMDGGASTVMLYRDTYGLYGKAGRVQTINNYSLLQAEPRRMPDFWMVRPAQ